MGHEWRLDGSPGRWLEVDLGSGATRTHHLSAEDLQRTVGGKMLATDLLQTHDTTDLDDALALPHPVADRPDVALHPTTPWSLFTGPYQSTRLGSTGRAVVTTRSPLTQLYLDTYIGGDLGHSLRRAGWDGLMLHGQAEQWTHLSIRDDAVELLPADHLVGLDTWQVEQRLETADDTAPPGTQTLSIGPAGESLVRIASPLTSGRRAAGRGGSGASLGAKRVKAITVHGTTEPRVADEDRLDTSIRTQRQNMGQKRRNRDPFYRFGTSRAPDYASKTDRIPTINYSTASGTRLRLSALAPTQMVAEAPIVGAVDMVTLAGPHWHDQHPDAKQSGCCTPCPIACEAAIRPAGHRGRAKHLPRADRPEYETLALLGSNLGIASADDVMDGNDACNRLGIDTISAGAALSLMCELAARDWFPDGWSEGDVTPAELDTLLDVPATHDPTRPLPAFRAPHAHGRFAAGDLVPWAFGLPELPPLALARLARASPGDGSLFSTLAAGAVLCADHVERVTGHPASRLTAHSKGLDLPAWDPRGKRGHGLAYMTSNVGSNHMRADYRGNTGIPDRSTVELVPELVASQHEKVLRDSWILCAFAVGATPQDVQLEAWRGLAGADSRGWDALMSSAARQWDQAREFNVAYWDAVGLSPRSQDVLSHRLRDEPLVDGPAKGMVSFASREDEVASLDAYYVERGWSEDGRPAGV